MKQHTLTTIGLFLLFLLGCQAYELNYRYQEERKKLHETIEGAFRLAIKQEITLRLLRQKPADPKNPQFIMRNAKDMTPEERAQLKGDTLTLGEAKEAGIGDNFVDVFAQRLQEAVIQSGKPLQIDAVDSLFHANLVEKDLIVNTQVFLLNSERLITDSTGGFKRDRSSGYLTPVIPVGTSGSYYLQGYAELPFWRPLNYMRLAILLSGLMILGTIVLLVGLLRRIRQSSQQLAERETVIHTAIHDLKAPLNIAYSTLDLIMLTEQQQERLKQLETGKRQIRLLVEVIESMLSLLKRPNKSQDDQKLEPVDLPALVEGILHTERQCHPEQCPITQVTREDSFPATVRINRIALMRCLHNAVDNAMKYGDAPTQVHVHLSLRGKQIQIHNRMHIWFIEDDVQLSGLIAEGLRILGHEVLTFPDLVGLRERLASKQPDLLLLDLELGARNAADLLPFIHSKYPELHLIVASSHSDGAEIAKCYDAGIQAYIKKPYDIRELDCIMRRLPVKGEPAVAQVHEDAYYLRAHALYRGDHEIQRLPDVEYRILQLLIARRGAVVTKEELCQSIWGEPNLDDRLNTAISRLRKLLPADCPWVLENQKRVGYSVRM